MPPQTLVSSYRRSLPETYPNEVCSSVRPRTSMSSVIQRGISLVCRGWTIPSFRGYSVCCAHPEEANAKAAIKTETCANTDRSREPFAISNDLRKTHLH